MRNLSKDKSGRSKLRTVFGVLLCLMIALTYLMPGQVFAADKSTEEKVVRIGYYENDNFQAGAGDDLVKTGYSYEYMRRLEAYTDWKYEYVYGEYGDLYDQLVKGEIDLLTGLAYQDKRKDIIGYPDLAMGDTPYSFLKRIDDNDITSDPQTIAGKKIGTIDGAMKGIVDEYLEGNHISADIVIFNDLKKRDKALTDGQIDIAIVEGNGTGTLEGVEAFAEAGQTDYFVCVNKKRPDILKDLNEGQAALFRAKPDIKETLNDKWFRTNAVSSTLSQGEKTWVSKHQELTVGYFDNYLPFSGTDSNGQVTGVIKDLMPELFNVLGVKDIQINYKGYPSYEDMLKALQKGEIDTAFPVHSDYWINEQYDLILTDPTINTYFNLVYKDNYPDISKTTIALRESNLLVQSFAEVQFPDSEIKLYASVSECLDAVAEGEVDATIIGGLRTDYIIRSKSKYNRLALSQIAEDAPLGFASGRDNQGTANILEHGIELIDPDFALTHSYQYEEKQRLTPLEFIKDNIWIAILGIILIALLAIGFIMRELHKNRKHLAETEAHQQALERAKEEAEAAKDAAEVANKAKTTFLFNMSHDIRTPLNAIKGFTELSDHEEDNPEKIRDYRAKVLTASNQLTDILNNVLEMARIENNKIVIEEELTDTREFFEACTMIFESEFKLKNLEFTSSMDMEHRYLYVDRTQMTEIAMNIISNAIKYTPEGGSIFTGIRELPGDSDSSCIVEITVRDSGIGMSEEFVDRIYDEFSRERTSSESKVQGTGLGMAIVKRLVDLMKGTIEINSSLGKGTEIILRIPHRIGEEPAGVCENQTADGNQDFTGKRILLAEDIDVNAILAQEILTMNGFEVERARDGVECTAMINEADAGYYDVILMDIQMPNMDGYQATHEIRSLKDPAKAGIPILALSANAFKEDRDKSAAAGMNGHIAKPIDVDELIRTLAEILK